MRGGRANEEVAQYFPVDRNREEAEIKTSVYCISSGIQLGLLGEGHHSWVC